MDDIKLAGKKQSIDPMWKVLTKEVDVGEPTSFLDHVYLGCTQRQCETSKDVVAHERTMFESRISVGATEKLPCSENLSISSWSHWRSCREMCGTILWVGEQNDSTTLQSFNVVHWRPLLQRRRIEILGRIVKSMLSNCSEMLFLGTHWKTRYSMVSEQTNLHHRSENEWTKACDKRLSRLISNIHHTGKYKQYCHVGNTAKQCLLGLVQDSDYGGDLEDTKSTSGGTLCIFGSHTFVPVSWMCKEQTLVFAQFNRIRNYFFGRRMKDGRDIRWFIGSDRRSSSRKHASEWSSTGRPVQISNAKENFMERLMI